MIGVVEAEQFLLEALALYILEDFSFSVLQLDHTNGYRSHGWVYVGCLSFLSLVAEFFRPLQVHLVTNY